MKSLHEKNIIDPKHHIEYSVEVKELCVDFNFKVTKFNPEPWNTNPSFSKTEPYKNHKLWEHDVFEVFLQSRPGEKSTDQPYLEIQVSPAEQKLALWIIKPRQVSVTPLTEQFKSWSTLSDDIWEGKISIPLNNEILNHPHLFAGVFACLGANREHFCHHKVEMEKIDFHRPDLFFKI